MELGWFSSAEGKHLCLYNDLCWSEIRINPVPSEADERQGADIDAVIDITCAEDKNISNLQSSASM